MHRSPAISRSLQAPRPCCLQALDTPVTLASLCADHLDVARQTLGHLSLRDLASLGRTCSALRSTVDQLLEAVWHAAAVREFPAAHPVALRTDTRQYLRLLHKARQGCAAGRCGSPGQV